MKYKQINKQNIWAEKLSNKIFENSPCLFLDRDGVLIDWKDYTMKTKDAKLIKDCDLVITGEGKLDSQTQQGKVISGVCNLAKKYNKSIKCNIRKSKRKI